MLACVASVSIGYFRAPVRGIFSLIGRPRKLERTQKMEGGGRGRGGEKRVKSICDRLFTRSQLATGKKSYREIHFLFLEREASSK